MDNRIQCKISQTRCIVFLGRMHVASLAFKSENGLCTEYVNYMLKD
uniref:Uncharacterized protein n=1 Tax=Rhizophora mucronata TaxID=61149 RepID=A0A2P2NXN8_RHIMU